MKGALLFIVIFSQYFVYCQKVNIDSNELYEWKSLLSVNTSCPRFILGETANEGMADQLERLFLAISLVIKYKENGLTLVVPDHFGRKSKHFSTGYHDIFHSVLGLPISILNYSYVREHYNPIESPIGYHKEYLDYMDSTRDYIVETPCNQLKIIDAYDSCNGWCPFAASEEMQAFVKPLLRVTLQKSSSCFHAPEFPLVKNELNLLWHVRSGDVCPHCDSIEYYNEIYSFILGMLSISGQSGITIRNIVAHTVDFTPRVDYLFQWIPNVIHFTTSNMTGVVCTFLNTDVLIATGSSFPSLVLWFSNQMQPVLMEDIRHSAVTEKAKYIYATRAMDSIRMENGKVKNNTTEDLHSALKNNGVFQRILGI